MSEEYHSVVKSNKDVTVTTVYDRDGKCILVETTKEDTSLLDLKKSIMDLDEREFKQIFIHQPPLCVHSYIFYYLNYIYNKVKPKLPNAESIEQLYNTEAYWKFQPTKEDGFKTMFDNPLFNRDVMLACIILGYYFSTNNFIDFEQIKILSSYITGKDEQTNEDKKCKICDKPFCVECLFNFSSYNHMIKGHREQKECEYCLNQDHMFKFIEESGITFTTSISFGGNNTFYLCDYITTYKIYILLDKIKDYITKLKEDTSKLCGINNYIGLVYRFIGLIYNNLYKKCIQYNQETEVKQVLYEKIHISDIDACYIPNIVLEIFKLFDVKYQLILNEIQPLMDKAKQSEDSVEVIRQMESIHNNTYDKMITPLSDITHIIASKVFEYASK